MVKAAVYCRISDDRLGSGLGVTRQEEDCRKLCAARGWTVAEVFVDNDISAYSGKPRPEYRRLLDALANGDVRAVVAWHPDRLHRSPRELEDFIDLLEKTKAAVATVTAGEYDLSTPSGRTVARIVGAVARGESEQKSERVRRKHLQLAEQGRSAGGGTRPFGYQPDRVTVDKAEAALIREAARRLLAGETLRGVAADWNARGIPTVGGGGWTTTVLRRVMTSGRVCGWREHHGVLVAEGVWPAILDRATVERLRGVLLDPARRTNSQPRRYLLTGLAHCSLCGSKLVARPRSDKRRSYVCASGPGFGGCGKIRVLADPLEEWVSKLCLTVIDTPEFAADLHGVEKLPAESEIMAEIEACETKLADLAEQWASDEIPRIAWRSASKRLEERLSNARKHLLLLDRGSPAAALAGTGAALSEGWDTMGFDARRAVLAAAVDTVEVAPGVKGLNRFDPRRVSVRWAR